MILINIDFVPSNHVLQGYALFKKCKYNVKCNIISLITEKAKMKSEK